MSSVQWCLLLYSRYTYSRYIPVSDTDTYSIGTSTVLYGLCSQFRIHYRVTSSHSQLSIINNKSIIIMVCNTIFGCIHPPEWMKRNRAVTARTIKGQRRRLCGFTLPLRTTWTSSQTGRITKRSCPHNRKNSYSHQQSWYASLFLRLFLPLYDYWRLSRVVWDVKSVAGSV